MEVKLRYKMSHWPKIPHRYAQNIEKYKSYRHPMNSTLAKTYPKPERRSSGNRPLFVSINCLRSAQWCFGSWSLLYLSTSHSVSQDPSIIFKFENPSESTFCICLCYFLLRAASRLAVGHQPEPGDLAGLEKGSEGRIGLREKNVGKNCINSRNLSFEVQTYIRQLWTNFLVKGGSFIW